MGRCGEYWALMVRALPGYHWGAPIGVIYLLEYDHLYEYNHFKCYY